MGLDNLPNILTVPQLAEFLQITEQTVRKALTSKKLIGFKIGNGWRIEKEEVLKWLNQK